jgi:hypothetical protein
MMMHARTHGQQCICSGSTQYALTLANLIWSSVSVLGSHSMDGIRPAASTLLLIVVVATASNGAMDSSWFPYTTLLLLSLLLFR